MATEFCQKCKQSHPGRLCDYDEKGECAETVEAENIKEEAPESRTSIESKTAARSRKKVTSRQN